VPRHHPGPIEDPIPDRRETLGKPTRSGRPTAASAARLVKLYAGTTEQFRADARMHRIAAKLRTNFANQMRHPPAGR
jgi:hypothetical protein